MVQFPDPASEEPPAWLPWTNDEWKFHRVTWYDAIDEVFNVNTYSKDFFNLGGKADDAEKSVAAFKEESDLSTDFTNVSAAKAWQRRVRLYCENIREALRQDAIPAPGRPHERWLLYPASCVITNVSSGSFSCQLCNKCRTSLSGVTGREKIPNVKMPVYARANGMWRGPDPNELSRLTYTECKVINLARIYVSVKRIFLNRAGYARTDATDAPLFHQKNVVAFPQSADAALKALGMSPRNLANILQVQFVGGDRTILRSQRELQVSVENLRSAFFWLSTNSWPFMEATKHHEAWESGCLEGNLEELLRQYSASTGSQNGGVPAEIIQGASLIAPELSKVALPGPADCVATDGDEGDTSATAALSSGQLADVADEPEDNECAGIIDGGVDEIKAVEIWDNIMKNYKVAQKCEDELERLKRSNKTDEKAVLQQQQALAVAAATEALSRFAQKDVRKRLNEFAASQRTNESVAIEHSDEFLSTRNPLFWYSCFVRLFPRGDCVEKCYNRKTMISSEQWVKTLLMRADSRLWFQDVEFVSCLHNIQLRQEQVKATEVFYKKLQMSVNEIQELAALTSVCLAGTALSSCDVESVRSVLRKRNLEKPVEGAFLAMRIVQRQVRGISIH